MNKIWETPAEISCNKYHSYESWINMKNLEIH